jgi:hypothetical protein
MDRSGNSSRHPAASTLQWSSPRKRSIRCVASSCQQSTRRMRERLLYRSSFQLYTACKPCPWSQTLLDSSWSGNPLGTRYTPCCPGYLSMSLRHTACTQTCRCCLSRSRQDRQSTQRILRTQQTDQEDKQSSFLLVMVKEVEVPHICVSVNYNHNEREEHCTMQGLTRRASTGIIPSGAQRATRTLGI